MSNDEVRNLTLWVIADSRSAHNDARKSDHFVDVLLAALESAGYLILKREEVEAAYREGFSDGADHQNLNWKYPPEDLAWYFSKARGGEIDKAITAACYDRGYGDPWPTPPASVKAGET